MAQAPQKPPVEPKQPEIKFRTKPVAERSIRESWAVLPAKTRLRVSIAITVFAAVGILVSDQLEKVMPAPKYSSKLSKPATPSESP